MAAMDNRPMTAELTILRPDDWHLHVRDGDALRAVVPHSARQFARGVVMPNLRPPVVTVEQALAHPNFAMGKVITTNSATLVNKGLEVIEAHLLFDVPFERSSWVALRQFPPLHTNPVDVRVGGAPIRASRRSALWCVGVIDQLWNK